MAEQTTAVFDDEKVRKFLDGVIKKTKKIKDTDKDYIKLLSANVVQDITDHFEKEQGPSGKWARWSPQYAIRQTRKGRVKVLQDVGEMKKSVAPGNVRKVSEGIEWFNLKEYSRKHDEGLGGMPKRTFMWLSDAGFDKIAEETLQYILEEQK